MRTLKNFSSNEMTFDEQTKTLTIKKEIIDEDEFINVENINTLILNGTVKIKYNAFYNCPDLENVIIGEGLEIIEKNAFENTKIESLSLPASLKEFTLPGMYTMLKDIKVSLDNPIFSSFDGVLYNKDMTKLICYPSNKEDKEFVIPSTIEELSREAFTNNRFIKKIDMSKATELKTISAYNFYNCIALNKVILPKYLKRIENSCFMDCMNLNEVVLPKTLTTIGTFSFLRSNKEKVFLKVFVENFDSIEATMKWKNDPMYTKGYNKIFIVHEKDIYEKIFNHEVSFKEAANIINEER